MTTRVLQYEHPVTKTTLQMLSGSCLAFMLSACGNEISQLRQESSQSATREQTIEIKEDKSLSAKHNIDHCPRLIQKRVDSTQVLRRDSLASQACDYFIYPKVGDFIVARVSDSRMTLSLRSPYMHDFANGGYHVIAKGRHVIRLEYNAIERQPAVLDYTIEVDIQPTQ